jgi:hypothetical protein
MGVIVVKAARGAIPDRVEGACEVGRREDLAFL